MSANMHQCVNCHTYNDSYTWTSAQSDDCTRSRMGKHTRDVCIGRSVVVCVFQNTVVPFVVDVLHANVTHTQTFTRVSAQLRAMV